MLTALILLATLGLVEIDGPVLRLHDADCGIDPELGCAYIAREECQKRALPGMFGPMWGIEYFGVVYSGGGAHCQFRCTQIKHHFRIECRPPQPPTPIPDPVTR